MDELEGDECIIRKRAPSCVLPSPGPESGGLEAVQVLVLGGVDFEQDYSEPLLLDVGPLCSDLA